VRHSCPGGAGVARFNARSNARSSRDFHLPPLASLAVADTAAVKDAEAVMQGRIETTPYASALHASQRVAWRLDDVLPQEARFDFERPFLPESLAATGALSFLSSDEQRALNHIRAHGYLCLFGLVEEFILPFVLGRLSARLDAELPEILALMAFAGEEAKHIELFRRFERRFAEGFGARCDVIGPAPAIRDHVLRKSELGVGLLILHIEWMTQQHYLEMVKGDASLEPSFARLLHQHWLEECQHARIDGWIVESVAASSSPGQRAQAFADYVSLLSFLEQGLDQQVELDRQALERAIGRALNDAERERFVDVQRQAQWRTFLGSGVTHPRVRSAIEAVYPAGSSSLAALAARYAPIEAAGGQVIQWPRPSAALSGASWTP
jgi:hypothetical protein